ncbi:unnamed protein product [Menidia menidia]|uniref:(Atlantic silverside) hypothetical protein n=1 Tax=Menidia menidia TaxID=238744 RepID=A0A8S4BNT0_9TELE|nr:unnamed protein product [Menidia menidia]
MLFPADIVEDVYGSDGDPTQSLALAEDPASPPLSDESSPRHLPYQLPSIFLPQEELTIPPDFELRESAILGGSLGIWSRRRVKVGECFGPYEGEHRPCLKDHSQGWEVALLRVAIQEQRAASPSEPVFYTEAPLSELASGLGPSPWPQFGLGQGLLVPSPAKTSTTSHRTIAASLICATPLHFAKYTLQLPNLIQA